MPAKLDFGDLHLNGQSAFIDEIRGRFDEVLRIDL